MKATLKPAIAVSNKSKSHEAKIIQLNAFQQPAQKQTAQLINAVWAVASCSLWFNHSFNDKDADQFKELIAEHFYNGKDSNRNFRELVERICLAKRYVSRKRGRYIAKPHDYLNIHYPSGLTGTAAWLEQVKIVRKDVPDYNKGITTLAKALLFFLENPVSASFHKGRKHLIEQRQFDLLQVYQHTIIHLLYKL